METATSPKPRAKRFVRPITPAPMQITGRDLKLVGHIARHRFLSTEQLVRLDGGSLQGVQRCLKALFGHGYLDRPKAQLAEIPLTGPRAMVYGITRKGARLLREQGQQIDDGARWSLKNKRAGGTFIEHTLQVADFMTRLELACQAEGGISLLQEHEIVARAPEKTQSAREPLRWSVPGLEKQFGVSSVIADALFGLTFPNDTAAYFLLELDRGTMPIVRRGFDRTSIARKLAIYWEGWKRERHVELFGLKQMRVLTVAPSRQRVDNMVAAVKDITGGGSNFFLFIERGRLMASSPLEAEWISGKGEAVRLTD